MPRIRAPKCSRARCTVRISQQITDAHLNALSTYHRARTYIKGDARATSCRFQKKKKKRERKKKGVQSELHSSSQRRSAVRGSSNTRRGSARRKRSRWNKYTRGGEGVPRPQTRRTLARVMMRLTLSFNIKHPTRILHRRRVTVNEGV